MWLEINFKNTKPFLIGILYRPPDSSNYSNTNFPTSLKEILQTASHENKEITIMRDVNCDYFVKDDHKEKKYIFTALGLKQLKKIANSSTLIDQSIKNEMTFRDNLLQKARKSKKESDWLTCKKKKNHVNNLIKVGKAEYNKLLLEENISKPEKVWKNLFPTKPKKEISGTKFIINEKTTSNENVIANGFCSFFQYAVSTLKANSIKLKNFTWSKPIKHQTNYAKRFNFQHVSVPVVRKHLKGLKRKKSDGIDQIPACLLKDCTNELAPPITCLINTILKTSKIPNGKVGKVTPIYKSGEKSIFDNYHPVTVLPIISKILEKCVYQQLIEHIESNNLLSKHQFGFRKRRSTKSAATLFLDDIHKAMDNSRLTGTIFIDLSKVFDTISYNSILEKLTTGREWSFFSDYLFNRW